MIINGKKKQNIKQTEKKKNIKMIISFWKNISFFFLKTKSWKHNVSWNTISNLVFLSLTPYMAEILMCFQ
jgi:hypothetical protein